MKGRTAISYEYPDINQIADIEVGNTKSGTANPPLISLRYNSSQTTLNSVLGEIHFGDNNTVNPQARISAYRDYASSGAGDLPSALSFGVTTDGTNTLSEKMILTSDGRLGIAISTWNEITHMLTVKGNNNTVKLIGTGAFGSGSIIQFGTEALFYTFISEYDDDNLQIHSTD